MHWIIKLVNNYKITLVYSCYYTIIFKYFKMLPFKLDSFQKNQKRRKKKTYIHYKNNLTSSIWHINITIHAFIMGKKCHQVFPHSPIDKPVHKPRSSIGYQSPHVTGVGVHPFGRK